MGDFIGKGHFGEVYKGILNGHTFCALKKVRSRSESSEKQENVLRQQLNDEVGQPATWGVDLFHTNWSGFLSSTG